MKTKILILMVAVFSLALGANAEKKNNKYETVEIKTSAFNEAGKKVVMKTLAFEKGVKAAFFVKESKTVRCVYQPNKTTPANIRTAISKAGFHADDVKRDARAYAKLPKECKPACSCGGKC